MNHHQILLLIFFAIATLSSRLWADVIIVSSPEAIVFSSANASQTTNTRLKKGRRLQTTGRITNGFYELKTKSGQGLWISKSDVVAENAGSDLVTPEHSTPQKKSPAKNVKSQSPKQSRNQASQSQSNQPQELRPRLTYNLGASFGSVGGESYQEANLTLNYFLNSWLIWRNGIFYRIVSKADDIYGLDSSIQGLWAAGLDSDTSIGMHAGPGVRLPNEGEAIPFVEAGLTLRLVGLRLGGGVKAFFNKVADNDAANDTQFFIVLSGSGSI